MLEASMQAKRRSVPVKVGQVTVGGDAPVVVQSMTNTDTADVDSTVRQVAALARAGRPNYTIELSSVAPETIGALLQLLEEIDERDARGITRKIEHLDLVDQRALARTALGDLLEARAKLGKVRGGRGDRGDR